MEVGAPDSPSDRRGLSWWAFRQRRARPDDILNAFGIVRPPVDVAQIAKDMGVVLHRLTEGEESGYVVGQPSGAEIHINVFEHPYRQRFTVAHEIGHLLLHALGVRYRDTTFQGSREEFQANKFAADLLMPFWMLDPVARQMGANPLRLSKVFEVSEHAMKIRLEQMLGMRR